MADIVEFLLGRDVEFRAMAGEAPLRAVYPSYDEYIDKINHKAITAQCVTTTDTLYQRTKSDPAAAIENLAALVYDGLPAAAKQHVVVCGGAVFEATKGRKTSYVPNQDIDIFLHGIDDEGVAAQFVQELVRHYRAQFSTVEDDYIDICLTCSAVTIVVYGRCKIQIILRLYKSISHILHGFDITAASLALLPDRTIVGTELALFSFRTGLCIIDSTRRSATFGKRIAKYGKRNLLLVWPYMNEEVAAKTLAWASYHGAKQTNGVIEFPGFDLHLKRRFGDRLYDASVRNANQDNISSRVSCPDYETIRTGVKISVTHLQQNEVAAAVRFRTESPDAQWTSSFDPMMTLPEDFYGRYFRPIETARPVNEVVPYVWNELPPAKQSDKWYTMEAVRSNPSVLNYEGLQTFENDRTCQGCDEMTLDDYIIAFMVGVVLRGIPISDYEVIKALRMIPGWGENSIDQIRQSLAQKRFDRYPAIEVQLRDTIISLLTKIDTQMKSPPTGASGKTRGKRSNDDEQEPDRRRRRIE